SACVLHISALLRHLHPFPTRRSSDLRLGILRADNAAVVVQEVAVVGGHGIGVELAIEGGSFHRAFQIAALYIVGVEGDFLQSTRSEEHTSELQSRFDLVCRLLPENKT